MACFRILVSALGLGFRRGRVGGVNGVILAMHVFNGELYVGGGFTYAGGGTVAVQNLAKWDGTQWYSIPGLVSIDNGVEAFADMNGKLYIGGAFFNINGIPMNKITVYDPLTGVNYNELQQSISVYPTITKSYITVENKKQLKLTASLADVTGKEIIAPFKFNRNSKINIQQINNGMYILKLTDGFNMLSKKIIVYH